MKINKLGCTQKRLSKIICIILAPGIGGVKTPQNGPTVQLMCIKRMQGRGQGCVSLERMAIQGLW